MAAANRFLRQSFLTEFNAEIMEGDEQRALRKWLRERPQTALEFVFVLERGSPEKTVKGHQEHNKILSSKLLSEEEDTHGRIQGPLQHEGNHSRMLT